MRTIAAERALKGWKQSDLAEKLGTTQATICLWENGKVVPSSGAIVKMAKLFGCTTDYLLGLSDSRV